MESDMNLRTYTEFSTSVKGTCLPESSTLSEHFNSFQDWLVSENKPPESQQNSLLSLQRISIEEHNLNQHNHERSCYRICSQNTYW